MRKTITTEQIPIKMWLDEIEDEALQQAKNLANLPFAFHHIALMPDAHVGFGMPIGGVLATKDVIVPNAVGVDIGCGMCAVKTSLQEISKDNLISIMKQIRQAIPVGFNKHKEMQDLDLMPADYEGREVVKKEFNNARKSIGTLGGGNHFIEIQKGSDKHIWIMVHSGSRNLGLQVAEHYNKIAIAKSSEFSQKYGDVPKEWDLAGLPVDSIDGKAYLTEMKYCVEFALANRKHMIDRIKQIFDKEFGNKVKYDDFINIAHNYAALETHFGEKVWVHRKGATLAKNRTIGIVPGSQGSKSYIVNGLGNKESFNSCSHGAGRLMGRNEAIRTLDLNAEIEKLKKLGVIHNIRGKNDLDEAPSAYKNIDKVMENQKDLVDVLVELTPLAVIKG